MASGEARARVPASGCEERGKEEKFNLDIVRSLHIRAVYIVPIENDIKRSK
jgi:hypothetical protein